jgi:NTP pyrophosphatase (non-canonical NTP hydrolase)
MTQRLKLVDEDVAAERERAHLIHGESSMRAFPPLDMNRLAILMEEAGEVAKGFNELRHGNVDEDTLRQSLYEELIQVAAMATDWAAAL